MNRELSIQIHVPLWKSQAKCKKQNNSNTKKTTPPNQTKKPPNTKLIHKKKKSQLVQHAVPNLMLLAFTEYIHLSIKGREEYGAYG